MADLYVLHAFLLHLACHLVYKVACLVIHDGVEEHEHNVTLKLGCRPCHAQFDVLFDRRQVNGSANTRHIKFIVCLNH